LIVGQRVLAQDAKKACMPAAPCHKAENADSTQAYFL